MYYSIRKKIKINSFSYTFRTFLFYLNIIEICVKILFLFLIIFPHKKNIVHLTFFGLRFFFCILKLNTFSHRKNSFNVYILQILVKSMLYYKYLLKRIII